MEPGKPGNDPSPTQVPAQPQPSVTQPAPAAEAAPGLAAPQNQAPVQPQVSATPPQTAPAQSQPAATPDPAAAAAPAQTSPPTTSDPMDVNLNSPAAKTVKLPVAASIVPALLIGLLVVLLSLAVLAYAFLG